MNGGRTKPLVLDGAGRMPSAVLASRRSMGLVVATTFGLIVWLVLWALGIKAFDSFMITVLVALVAVTVRMLAPYLPGNRDA
jgi:hypothetical protein